MRLIDVLISLVGAACTELRKSVFYGNLKNMKTALLVGGPLGLALTLTFLIWSGIITFGEIDGIEHQAGVGPRGTFNLDASQGSSDESGEFSETAGLELKDEPIEYRQGNEVTTVVKQPGLSKYTNITLRWPTGIDTDNWHFIFAAKTARENCMDCNGNVEGEAELDAGTEMYEIDPPVLVIPAR